MVGRLRQDKQRWFEVDKPIFEAETCCDGEVWAETLGDFELPQGAWPDAGNGFSWFYAMHVVLGGVSTTCVADLLGHGGADMEDGRCDLTDLAVPNDDAELRYKVFRVYTPKEIICLLENQKHVC